MKRLIFLIANILLLTQFSSAQVFIPHSFWAGITAPILTISDGATYNYGTLAINTGVDKIFTVSNDPAAGIATNITAAAFATAAYTFKGGTYPGTGGTCSTTLNPSASCSIVVTALSAAGGTFNDTITLNHKDSRGMGAYAATRAITATFITTPTDLKLITSDFIKVNDCVAATIQSTDTNGNLLNVAANTTVTLTINNAINSNFYTTSACSVTTTTRTITAGTNSVVAYFKSTTANQSGILIATATGLTSGQKNIIITSAPTKLKILAVPQMKTNTCNTYSVHTVDSNGYDSAAGSNVTVNLTTNGANVYYSDSGCTTVITSTVIASGSFSSNIYTKDATIQTLTSTATDNAAVLTADTANINFLLTLTWWDTNWPKRMTIQINNTDQATSFTNQAVLVKLNSSIINYANFNANGSDLRFVASDNTTVLSHEIETWNPSGTSEIWVKIPSITASVDTDYFFMYFNNAGATDAQNKAGVWSSYWSVWHFNEDPAGTAPQYKDSTGSGRDGTAVSGPTRVSAGPIGYAAGLNAAADYIQISGDLSVALGGSSTFSAWMRTTQSGTGTVSNTPGLTGINAAGTANDIYFGWIDVAGFIGITATNGGNVVSSFTINNGAWRHVTMSRNSATGDCRFYINGVFQTVNASGMGVATTYFDRIGQITGVAKYYDGDIDEVRIYNSIKSDAQIQADFKFMMNTNLTYNTTEVWP